MPRVPRTAKVIAAVLLTLVVACPISTLARPAFKHEHTEPRGMGRAPYNIEADLIDGGKFELASHKDKNIVLLCYWSPTSDPEAKVLTMAATLVDKFKDQNVILCTVSTERNTEAVKKFLETHKLKVPVVVDTEKGTFNYMLGAHAEKSPAIILVGKTGTMQGHHPGATVEMEKLLTMELKKLTEGTNLWPDRK